MNISRNLKIGIALLMGSVTAAWLFLAYIPNHLMSRGSSNYFLVNVDDRPARAEVYYANPTKYEAEGFLLVRVQGLGDYMLRFGGEDYREASRREFICLLGKAWTFKSMQEGQFRPPLAQGELNQMSFLSRGHRVTVHL